MVRTWCGRIISLLFWLRRNCKIFSLWLSGHPALNHQLWPHNYKLTDAHLGTSVSHAAHNLWQKPLSLFMYELSEILIKAVHHIMHGGYQIKDNIIIEKKFIKLHCTFGWQQESDQLNKNIPKHFSFFFFSLFWMKCVRQIYLRKMSSRSPPSNPCKIQRFCHI